MATLSFGPLMCESHTFVGTPVVIPFPKNLQLAASYTVDGEKLSIWVFFLLFVQLCVHSHVHFYTLHSVDTAKERGEIKHIQRKGSNSLNWNVTVEKPSIQGL